MDIELFLAHADDQRPVLERGIPPRDALEARSPDMPELSARRTANLDAPPDALPGQRWALVVPKGSAGDRLLSLVAPLRKKREEEQGAEAIVYQVDPGMDPVAAATWIQKEYRDAVQRVEAARPRYLALLGGPDVISWDLQQMLGGEAFVGRIAFDDERGYEAYVEKAVRFADAVEAPRAKALYHAVPDGSRAMSEGDRHLMQPSLKMARAEKETGAFDAEELLDFGGSSRDADDWRREAAKTRAAMLFTMSHGAGRPASGWPSLKEQHALQGALVLGGRGNLLKASDVAETPFLPGGVWFMFACYGAGTPSRSAYFPWLSELHALGLGGAADQVLPALPQNGEPPFVAALPQAALANPEGPLGVLGHVDLAWSWSFLDYDVDASGLAPKSRAERFQGVLKALVNGHRFGVAHNELAHFFRSVSAELTVSYEACAQQAVAIPAFMEGQLQKVRRANLWMQRQDLAAFVLLGDPAARLPIGRGPAGISRRPPAPPGDDTREETVLAVLRGTASIATMATRLGVSRQEIEDWAGIFLEAGRAALRKNP